MTSTETFAIDVAEETVQGSLVLPSGASASPCPAVLICNNLPGEIEAETQFLDSVVEQLTRIGIASVSIDTAPLPISGLPRASVYVDQAEAALDWMASRDDLDRSRIALLGYSHASVIATGVAARSHQPSVICLIAPTTVRHLRERLTAGRHGSAAGKAANGAPQVSSEFLASLDDLSPMSDLTAHPRPVLVLHGAADRVIDAAVSVAYLDALETSEHEVDRRLIARADHAFTNDAARSVCLDCLAEFLESTLVRSKAASVK